jgi:ABC-type sugar transport system ATPase subunit
MTVDEPTSGAADRPVAAAAGADVPLVRMRGIAKRFPGVVALDGVDFELRAGEIHAVAGENGSGKSTLAKILYGAHQADEGTVEIDGEPVSFSSPREALAQGIVAISQELTLAPTLSVAENILMGRLPRRRSMIAWSSMRTEARAALEQLGVDVDPDERVGRLSIELQQEVEVARAVSANSRVLILDEATSSLSEAATEALMRRITQLRAQGVAIIFISHRLRELYACADRATVLRDGKLIGTVPLSECSENELVRMMVGREISDLYGKRQIEKREPRLSVRGLTSVDGRVQDATFDVKGGEIVGVAGLVGSGKTELALALAGAIGATGEIVVDGRERSIGAPRDAIRAGIGFVPEDRKRAGLFPTRNVAENLSLGWLRMLSRHGVIDVIRERRLTAETASRFAVRTPSLDRSIRTLSGGNQQKVVLGRSFTLAPDVIVLAEPTRGIDVGAKSEVYRFIQDMAENGAAVLMISSELPELLGLSDRILVMFRGRIVGVFDGATAQEEEIAHLAMGGAVAAEAAV